MGRIDNFVCRQRHRTVLRKFQRSERRGRATTQQTFVVKRALVVKSAGLRPCDQKIESFGTNVVPRIRRRHHNAGIEVRRPMLRQKVQLVPVSAISLHMRPPLRTVKRNPVRNNAHRPLGQRHRQQRCQRSPHLYVAIKIDDPFIRLLKDMRDEQTKQRRTIDVGSEKSFRDRSVQLLDKPLRNRPNYRASGVLQDALTLIR